MSGEMIDTVTVSEHTHRLFCFEIIYLGALAHGFGIYQYFF